MASFPLNFVFFIQPQFENVSLTIDRLNFACLSLNHIANYSCFF